TTERLVLNSPREARLASLARSANDTFTSIFYRNRGARRNGGDIGKLLRELNAGEDGVVEPLESLMNFNIDEVRADEASSASANNEALAAAIVGGALGLIAVLAFAFYAFRLVERLEDSEQRLKIVLDSMSDGLVVADADGNFVIF